MPPLLPVGGAAGRALLHPNSALVALLLLPSTRAYNSRRNNFTTPAAAAERSGADLVQLLISNSLLGAKEFTAVSMQHTQCSVAGRTLAPACQHPFRAQHPRRQHVRQLTRCEVAKPGGGARFEDDGAQGSGAPPIDSECCW